MMQKVAALSLTLSLVLVLGAGVLAQDPEENDVPGSEPADGSVPPVRRPLNLGVNIPQIFNMKLLTGDRQGTGLGIDIPAILRLRLDGRGQQDSVEGRSSVPGPRSLLISLFGSDVFNGKRPSVVAVPEADHEEADAETEDEGKEV